MSLNETQLKTFNKDKLIAYALDLQSQLKSFDDLIEKLDQALLQIRLMNERFEKLEAELAVSRKVNDTLLSRIR